MDDAARHFVDIFELQQAAGRKLAELSGAESGMVTSGAAGAMAAATAGCMAGTDPDKVWQLPDTTGMENEVVMVRSQRRNSTSKAKETASSSTDRPMAASVSLSSAA